MKLISPSDFKTTLWKNGTGKTTELAISENSTLADFDWRISIASVVDDSPFSEFAGFDRCLVLLAGAGMQLHHVSPVGQHTTDSLKNTLDMAQFDGCSTTTPTLVDGPIMDFNVMTKTGRWCAVTRVCCNEEELAMINSLKTFIYGVVDETQVKSLQPAATWSLPQGHLLQLEAHEFSSLLIRGQGCIVIQISAVIS